jgi:hypothetical protein
MDVSYYYPVATHIVQHVAKAPILFIHNILNDIQKHDFCHGWIDVVIDKQYKYPLNSLLSLLDGVFLG